MFDKLEADLAKARDVAARVEGLRDRIRLRGDDADGARAQRRLRARTATASATHTNHSGGVQGGISNGEDDRHPRRLQADGDDRAAQQTVTPTDEATTLEAKGRHDPCVLPRAVPMVEAAMLLTLADHWLRQRAVDVLT